MQCEAVAMATSSSERPESILNQIRDDRLDICSCSSGSDRSTSPFALQHTSFPLLSHVRPDLSSAQRTAASLTCTENTQEEMLPAGCQANESHHGQNTKIYMHEVRTHG